MGITHLVVWAGPHRAPYGDCRPVQDAVLAEAGRHGLLSDEHFTVDGTLLESWASLKSFRPKDGGDAPPPGGNGRNPAVDFHGQKRSNATHASTTDPDARLARKGKGKEAKLCLAGHVLMENRNGLAVDVLLTHATGTAEREAALVMLDRQPGSSHCVTLGADKAYDTLDFVQARRERQVTAHVAQNTSGRRSAIDGRTTRHPGYSISQRIRERVEEIFGWKKTVGGGRKLRYLGLARNQCWAELTTAADNLVRMVKLLPAATEAPLRRPPPAANGTNRGSTHDHHQPVPPAQTALSPSNEAFFSTLLVSPSIVRSSG